MYSKQTHLNNNVVIFSHQQRRKGVENAQDFFSFSLSCKYQDQDQDLCFCPGGALALVSVTSSLIVSNAIASSFTLLNDKRAW